MDSLNNSNQNIGFFCHEIQIVHFEDQDIEKTLQTLEAFKFLFKLTFETGATVIYGLSYSIQK